MPVPSHPNTLLTINGGSSSLKFALFPHASLDRIADGAVSGIGTRETTLDAVVKGHPMRADLDTTVSTLPDAARWLFAWLQADLLSQPPAAVVHRVVHGGADLTTATAITSDVVEALRALIPFAPLHLPGEIALLELSQRAFPDSRHVACFDTAFHRDLPIVARTLTVPAGDSRTVRRFGFHGLACTYLMEELHRTSGDAIADGRVLLAHLGHGASITAVRGGRSIDTSMGLTPAGGLVMSTRSGDLDPGIVTLLARRNGWSADDLDRVLTTQSGLKAISGSAGDMRQLLAVMATDPHAQLAVAVFCYQARKWIGAMTAALEGLDAIVFSGGIGEHAAHVRAAICQPLTHLGVRLDTARNTANASIISANDSPVLVRVIAADEAVVMAREAAAVIAARTDRRSGQDQEDSHD